MPKVFVSEKTKPDHMEHHYKIMRYPWRLLKARYKYAKTASLIASHTKKAIAEATNMEKIYFVVS